MSEIEAGLTADDPALVRRFERTAPGRGGCLRFVIFALVVAGTLIGCLTAIATAS
ncbi:MAG: DUF3040 domain-containing protein [Leifsonia sp.]